MDIQEIKEAIEFIETIFAIADNDESKQTKGEPEPCFQKIKRLADQALVLLKQQPTASEFTNRIRTEPYNPKWEHTVIIQTEDRDALCACLDTAEATIKLFKRGMEQKHKLWRKAEAIKTDLLEALEEAERDFYYIHQHPEDAHTDSYNFMEKVKQAKAKK